MAGFGFYYGRLCVYLAEGKFTGSLTRKLCRSITAASAFGGSLLELVCFLVHRMNLMER